LLICLAREQPGGFGQRRASHGHRNSPERGIVRAEEGVIGFVIALDDNACRLCTSMLF
jgi:hypothetical protein